MIFTSSNKLKKWTAPDILAEVSLGHLLADNLPPVLRSSAVENYLLISMYSAVTNRHTDFSHSSVMYIVLTGCKEFLHSAPVSSKSALLFRFQKENGK